MLRMVATGFVLAVMTGLTIGQSSSHRLEPGFQQPPDSAKPRVWWHWMNGNISKEGIELDLEWMHRAGRVSELRCRAGHTQVVDHRLAYMTPEWKEAFKYATTLADQLGMEGAIAGSPDWSETGGPGPGVAGKQRETTYDSQEHRDEHLSPIYSDTPRCYLSAYEDRAGCRRSYAAHSRESRRALSRPTRRQTSFLAGRYGMGAVSTLES
jgi:hypothetical protein